MGVLERFGGSALKYYQTILNAAYQGMSNADMWAAIHRQAANYGLPTPQTQPPDASVIRGYANRIVNGARTLARASNSDTITADMMAIAPYTANDYNTIVSNPTYQVRFQMVYQQPDGTVDTRWSISVYDKTNFPKTVGDLRTSILTNADEMSAQMAQQSGGKSGGRLLGTGILEISMV